MGNGAVSIKIDLIFLLLFCMAWFLDHNLFCIKHVSLYFVITAFVSEIASHITWRRAGRWKCKFLCHVWRICREMGDPWRY